MALNIDEVSETWIVEPDDIYDLDSSIDKSTFLANVIQITGITPDYELTASGQYVATSGYLNTDVP